MNTTHVDLTTVELPDCQRILDAGMSLFPPACVSASRTLGIFDVLENAPRTAGEIAASLDLDEGAVDAIALVLAAYDFLKKDGEAFSLSAFSKAYLIPSSPLFWGADVRRTETREYKKVIETARESGGYLTAEGSGATFSSSWQEGTLSAEAAARFTSVMHNITLAPALASARSGAFQGVEHLIDAGGGSGSFCIALHTHQPETRSTLMDLPVVCEAALAILEQYGCGEAVTRHPANFFKDEWATGADAYHMSNILHNWPIEQCKTLLAKTFAALPSGGRFFVHEGLLDESKTSPRPNVVFNLAMYISFGAQQFTKSELFGLLAQAGFIEPEIVHTFSHYSLVSARKP